MSALGARAYSQAIEFPMRSLRAWFLRSVRSVVTKSLMSFCAHSALGARLPSPHTPLRACAREVRAAQDALPAGAAAEAASPCAAMRGESMTLATAAKCTIRPCLRRSPARVCCVTGRTIAAMTVAASENRVGTKDATVNPASSPRNSCLACWSRTDGAAARVVGPSISPVDALAESSSVMTERLPNRRPAVTEEIEVANMRLTASVGFAADGRPAEVFLSGPKDGTDLAAILADAALVISIALQHAFLRQCSAKVFPGCPSPSTAPQRLRPRRSAPRLISWPDSRRTLWSHAWRSGHPPRPQSIAAQDARIRYDPIHFPIFLHRDDTEMKWQKGQSGNPGGRPKALQEVEEAARQHTPAAMEALVSIAKNEEAPPAARVSAASVLLDRAWGKPRQDMRVERVADDFEEMSDEELRELVRVRQEQLARPEESSMAVVKKKTAKAAVKLSQQLH